MRLQVRSLTLLTEVYKKKKKKKESQPNKAGLLDSWRCVEVRCDNCLRPLGGDGMRPAFRFRPRAGV